MRPIASWLPGVLALVVAGCPRGPEPPRELPPTTAAAVVTPEPSAPLPVQEPAPTPSAAASAEPAAPPPPVTTVALAPEKPCTFRWAAANFEGDDEGWTVVGVSRIATEEGGVCKASVLWDVDAGVGVGCDGAHDPVACEKSPPFDVESLDGGRLHTGGAAPSGEWTGIELSDMNFDGFRDLCVQKMMGAYNYSQICWLFAPAKGIFERYEPLDDVIWASFDPVKRQIKNGMRLGGPAYMSQILAWEKGELVVLERVETLLGEKPDGTPLFDDESWEVLYQRKGGRLVKVRQGVRKSGD